jgi:hypothetical protein
MEAIHYTTNMSFQSTEATKEWRNEGVVVHAVAPQSPHNFYTVSGDGIGNWAL